MRYFKYIVLYVFMIICFPAFSGGGSPWTPPDPSNCVMVKEKPITFTWNNNSQCEHAINSGFATGIYIFGTVSYVPDPETAFFNYIIHKGETVTVANLGIYGVVNGYEAKLASKPTFRWK